MGSALGDFATEQLIFEFHYDEAFLLWDRAGEVGRRIAERWRGAKLVAAVPGQIAFQLDRLELSVELQKARVTQHHPTGDALEAFDKAAGAFSDLVVNVLEVTQINRAILRTIFFFGTGTTKQAAERVLRTNVLQLPPGRHFDSEDGPPTHAEYAVRLEGKARGTLLRLKSDNKRLEVTAPAAIKQLESRVEEFPGIVFDVEHYTRAPLLALQFAAEDWVAGARRLIRRDSEAFVRGIS